MPHPESGDRRESPPESSGSQRASDSQRASGSQRASDSQREHDPDSRADGRSEQPVSRPSRPSPAEDRTRSRWKLRTVVVLSVVAAVIVVLVGLGLVQRAGMLTGNGDTTAAGDESSTGKYICPMMCTPPLDEPGRCPVCGMQLVPATGAGGDGDGRSIVVEPVARRIAGIETTEVESVPLVRQLRAVGKLEYNQSGMKTLAAYVDGRIERLFADYTGVEVSRGDRLAILYSPELYSAQVEFLAARGDGTPGGMDRNRGLGLNRTLLDSARQRLIELGMQQQQIAELEESGEARSRLDLYAEITGTVIEKFATEGDYVRTGQKVYRLADLSNVWLMLELFPEDASHIRYGQKVDAEVQSLPGESFTGRVAFVDPAVDPETRTVGVRVVVPNPNGRLRVGDFATAHVEIPLGRSGDPTDEIYDEELAGKWISPRHPHVISDTPGPCPVCGIEMVAADDLGYPSRPVDRREALGVPRRSVLRAGKTSLVYVETEPGRFEPRRVTLGPNIEDSVIVLDGLQPDDRVATTGNFLIDSQMQLAGNPSLIDPTRITDGGVMPADPHAGHDHEGEDQSLDDVTLSDEHREKLKGLSDADRELALRQKACPVTGMPLGSMGQPVAVEVDGRRALLCCEACRQRILDSPDRFLSRLPDPDPDPDDDDDDDPDPDDDDDDDEDKDEDEDEDEDEDGDDHEERESGADPSHQRGAGEQGSPSRGKSDEDASSQNASGPNATSRLPGASLHRGEASR